MRSLILAVLAVVGLAGLSGSAVGQMPPPPPPEIEFLTITVWDTETYGSSSWEWYTTEFSSTGSGNVSIPNSCIGKAFTIYGRIKNAGSISWDNVNDDRQLFAGKYYSGMEVGGGYVYAYVVCDENCFFEATFTGTNTGPNQSWDSQDTLEAGSNLLDFKYKEDELINSSPAQWLWVTKLSGTANVIVSNP